MSKFVLEIQTTNAAFAEGYGAEVARILRAAAADIEFGSGAGALRDYNGNAVGYYAKED